MQFSHPESRTLDILLRYSDQSKLRIWTEQSSGPLTQCDHFINRSLLEHVQLTQYLCYFGYLILYGQFIKDGSQDVQQSDGEILSYEHMGEKLEQKRRSWTLKGMNEWTDERMNRWTVESWRWWLLEKNGHALAKELVIVILTLIYYELFLEI